MKLYYISANLEKLMKENKINEEEILKMGNMILCDVAEQYYKAPKEYKEYAKNLIKNVRQKL